MDFVLWKPSLAEDDESSKFKSPWGLGRPGWHIECTTMSTNLLGETYDIHGGGVDLIFPHHENEQAQALCCNKGSEYARHWVHNGFLTVNGEKMSKSLGNFTTVQELLDKNIKGEVIKLALLTSHYRKPLDWNEKLLKDCKKQLDNWYKIAESFEQAGQNIPQNTPIDQDFIACLNNDLNTSKAFALINSYAKQARKNNTESAKKLVTCLKLMGFLQDKTWFDNLDDSADKTEVDKTLVEDLIKKRIEAKNNKDYALADKIRDDLKNMGVEVIDNKI